MVRGPGKFKLKRGGGRNFSKNLGDRDNRWRNSDEIEGEDIDEEDENEDEDDKESEEEEESSEEEESAEPSASGPPQPELTRAQRKELKKKQGGKEKAKAEAKKDNEEEDADADADDILVNPNHVQKKMTISDLNQPRELTRRERLEKETKEAKERRWKLHLQGKTPEAQKDLQRLAKIRAERDMEQAKRKAEAEAKAKLAEEKKQAQLAKNSKK